MVSASDFGSEGCRFESCQYRFFDFLKYMAMEAPRRQRLKPSEMSVDKKIYFIGQNIRFSFCDTNVAQVYIKVY
jgi:hypothetical protein